MECATVDCGMPDCEIGYTPVLPAAECCHVCIEEGACAEGNARLREDYENILSYNLQCEADSDCTARDFTTGCWTACGFAYNINYEADLLNALAELDAQYCSACELGHTMACPDMERKVVCNFGWCTAY
jgi:hypothetical protein